MCVRVCVWEGEGGGERDAETETDLVYLSTPSEPETRFETVAPAYTDMDVWVYVCSSSPKLKKQPGIHSQDELVSYVHITLKGCM